MKLTGSVDPASLRALTDAINLYKKATDKDLPDVLNHALKQVAIFASHKTPVADKAKIESELRRIVGYVTHGKSGRLLKKARAIRKPMSLAYAILVARAKRKGEKIPPGDLEAKANAMIESRKRGVGYERAGYIPALQATHAPLGGAKARNVAHLRPIGTASLATTANALASLANQVPGISKVGKGALDAAVAEAAVDLETYARKKLDDRAERFNSHREG